MKAELINTEPDEVIHDDIAKLTLAMRRLATSAPAVIEARQQKAQGQPLFCDGEKLSLKGCTFTVVACAGPLMVVRYAGLTARQQRVQIGAALAARSRKGMR